MTDISSPRRLDPNEQHFRIAGPRDGLSLFLRLLPAGTGGASGSDAAGALAGKHPFFARR
jgi:hypothetical protein